MVINATLKCIPELLFEFHMDTLIYICQPIENEIIYCCIQVKQVVESETIGKLVYSLGWTKRVQECKLKKQGVKDMDTIKKTFIKLMLAAFNIICTPQPKCKTHMLFNMTVYTYGLLYMVEC